MSTTLKRIWIAYALFSVCFGVYAVMSDGDI